MGGFNASSQPNKTGVKWIHATMSLRVCVCHSITDEDREEIKRIFHSHLKMRHIKKDSGVFAVGRCSCSLIILSLKFQSWVKGLLSYLPESYICHNDGPFLSLMSDIS